MPKCSDRRISAVYYRHVLAGLGPHWGIHGRRLLLYRWRCGIAPAGSRRTPRPYETGKTAPGETILPAPLRHRLLPCEVGFRGGPTPFEEILAVVAYSVWL